MSLFYNYKKAGSGVSKNGPKKKPFFLYWEIFGNKFWKLFQVNMIYVLFCLPVVTFGPATAAMTQVMRKFVIGEPIFVFHEFFAAFKKNFKQSFVIGLIDVGIIALIFFNLNFYTGALTGESELSMKIMLALSLAMCFFVIMMHFYIYPQIVALNLKLPQIIKNSLILMIVGFKRSFAAFFAWMAMAALIVAFLPYSFMVLPFAPFGWMSFTATFCAYPVIQKHIIDPYYESRGEKNPEYERYETGEDAIFEDMGGLEAPVDFTGDKKEKRASGGGVKVRTKGKVIR